MILSNNQIYHKFNRLINNKIVIKSMIVQSFPIKKLLIKSNFILKGYKIKIKMDIQYLI